MISKILIKIWPSLTKFWSNFDLKFFFLQTQNGSCQDELISKVWTFYLTPFKSYLAWCAQNSKANFTVTLRPLKLQIAEKVPWPMKFRLKPLVFTYPHPFWKVLVPIQVLRTHSTHSIPTVRSSNFSPKITEIRGGSNSGQILQDKKPY